MYKFFMEMVCDNSTLIQQLPLLSLIFFLLLASISKSSKVETVLFLY